MKLIDILVEELPKRGGWPAKASHAVYAKRFSRVLFTKGGAPVIVGDDVSIFEDDGAGRGVFWLPGVMLNCGEPVDYATSIITSEQYESALAAKNDGWIEWGGGECPVDAGKMVDVIFGYGGRRSTNIADCWRWNHNGTDSDIIAYRLHKPKEIAQTEAGQETDMNELIGQEPSALWNGDGLPPVGCECEYRKHKKSEQREWFNGVVKYASEFTVVIQPICYPGETVGHPANFEFRPILSEAERKRHESVQALCDAGGGNGKVDENAGYGSCWFDMYDAIADGKIPGVKLED